MSTSMPSFRIMAALFALVLSCISLMACAMPGAYHSKSGTSLYSPEPITTVDDAVAGAPVAGRRMSTRGGSGGGEFRGVASVPEAVPPSAPPPPESAALSGGKPAEPAQLPPSPKPAANRKIIYTGTLSLLVANKISGREEVDKIIKQYDGIIANATLDEVTFRIAPERFDAAMAELSKVGEVAAREVRSEDVTAQYFDLNLRIEVAEGSRQRLMEILKKAGAVKDVLEVERDIRRLTEEIEQLKGSLRLMQDRIDLATITVRLQEKRMVIQPRRHSLSSIFAWMDQVGLDNVLGPVPTNAPLKGGSLFHRLFGTRFALATGTPDPLPSGFLPVVNDGRTLIGVTPQDYRLRLQLLSLRQEGKLDFWAEALANEFKDQRGYIVRAREEFKLTSPDLRAVVLRCETAVGADPWAHEVWLIQSNRAPGKLLIAEYARQKSAPADQLSAVEQALRGLKLD